MPTRNAKDMVMDSTQVRATEYIAAAAQIQLLPSTAHFVVLELIILMCYARVTLCIAYVHPQSSISNGLATTQCIFSRSSANDRQMCAKYISKYVSVIPSSCISCVDTATQDSTFFDSLYPILLLGTPKFAEKTHRFKPSKY